AERLERVHAGLKVRPGRTARRADGARPVPGARPVGDEIVSRRADDGDVGTYELGRILRVGLASIREEAREVGLLAVAPPAFERVEHRAILPVCARPARVPVEGKQKPKG